MSRAARLMLWGLVLVAAGVAAYLSVDWAGVLARYPHYVRPLKGALRPALTLAWYWAYAVPVLLLLVSVYRFFVSRSGRAFIAWRLFAYLTLWALGSFSFFFGLFLVYAPGLGEGGTELLAPALLASLGYILVGLGFVTSALDRG